MPDPATMAVYAQAAADYAKGAQPRKQIDQEDDLTAFTALVPPGARVLDLGCGPGQWAHRLSQLGFDVDATDASPEMVALANARHGLNARVAPFETLSGTALYDGIWANFSLLHAPRHTFPGLLSTLHTLLRPHGALHLGMKLGTGEGRDDLGRFFAYYTQPELIALLCTAGFTPLRTRRGNGEGRAGGPDTFIVVTAHG